MDNGEIEESDDNEFPGSQGRGGRKYTPVAVVAHDTDRAVLQMSSLDPESSSSSFPNPDNSFFNMIGEQIPAPSSPRDGLDAPITLECPKDCWYRWHRRVIIASRILWLVYFLDINIVECYCN